MMTARQRVKVGVAIETAIGAVAAVETAEMKIQGGKSPLSSAMDVVRSTTIHGHAKE
jgi:hypothetical protein